VPYVAREATFGPCNSLTPEATYGTLHENLLNA